MTEIERVQYLIDRLAMGSSSAFARHCSIRPDSLCHALAGRLNITTYFPRILSAFPNVRKEWLLREQGEPMWEDYERNKVLEKLDKLTDEVRELRKEILMLKNKK